MSTIVSAALLPAHASGPYLIPAAAGCYYPPAVEGPDLLEVDSSVRELVSDGLYLVEDPEHCWRGCRRFQATGGAWIMDRTGTQDWVRVTKDRPEGLTIVARVNKVYKPAVV